jgi:hypothetical protein
LSYATALSQQDGTKMGPNERGASILYEIVILVMNAFFVSKHINSCHLKKKINEKREIFI